VGTHQSSETIFAVVYVFDGSSGRASRSLLRWTVVVDAETGAVVDVEEW
jgi:predicted small secreted protein